MAEDGSTEGSEFEVLAHPMRIGILEALAGALREGEGTVGFSDLRRRVGVRDSGNFNYHLDRLTGRFVRDTGDGYRITAAGLRVVAATIAGVYGGGTRLGPTEIGDECPVCGEGLSATYENGLLTVACPNDHEFQHPLPPGSVDDRDLEEVVDLLVLTTHQDLELAVEGVCPLCRARLDWSIDPPFDPEFPHFSTACDRCGVSVDVPVPAALLTDPAVLSFFHDHGVDVRRRPPWAPEFYRDVAVGVATDPLRVAVTVTLDGEELTATLDGTLSVREVDRSDPGSDRPGSDEF